MLCLFKMVIFEIIIIFERFFFGQYRWLQSKELNLYSNIHDDPRTLREMIIDKNETVDHGNSNHVLSHHPNWSFCGK